MVGFFALFGRRWLGFSRFRSISSGVRRFLFRLRVSLFFFPSFLFFFVVVVVVVFWRIFCFGFQVFLLLPLFVFCFTSSGFRFLAKSESLISLLSYGLLLVAAGPIGDGRAGKLNRTQSNPVKLDKTQ